MRGKEIKAEMDTSVKPFASEKKPHRNSHSVSIDVLQKYGLSNCENPLTKFWYETLNENRQGQKRCFDILSSQMASNRFQKGAKAISYTQLLEFLRHFAVQEGLPLYGILRKKGCRKPQHS